MDCQRVGSQVSFTSLEFHLPCCILVANILSSVSHPLIALSHQLLISSSVCIWSGFPMTLLHCRAHMRWAASDMRICRRHSASHFLGRWSLIPHLLGISQGPFLGSDMDSHLSMMPR